MLEMMTKRLQIREATVDDLPALLPIYLSNPAFAEQNEGSEGEIGLYDLDRWQREMKETSNLQAGSRNFSSWSMQLNHSVF